MQKSVNITGMSHMRDFVTEFSNFGEDYVFTHQNGPEFNKMLNKGPIRTSGLAWILCVAGHIELEINLKRCSMHANSLMILPSDCIVEIKECDSERLDVYVLFVAPDFIRNINFDPNVIGTVPLGYARSLEPVIQLTADEVTLLRRYFDLIHLNTTANSGEVYVRSIARNLIAAMLYQVIQFAVARLGSEEAPRPRSRRSTYVQDFMALVHRHHTRERSVAFYAGKLYISPKYLSMLVKEHTGRSAAEWIDEFVILEAKNLLRYSGKNVQQVAYELNFPNQSSFGKYFKHLTSMSPTTYQKS